METNLVEIKKLLKLNGQLYHSANLIDLYRRDKAVLKSVLKLINKQRKSYAAQHKGAVDEFMTYYDSLLIIAKTMIKGGEQASNAGYELDKTIEVLSATLTELRAKLAAASVVDSSKKIVDVIGDKAQKIGEAVTEKLGGIKKMLSGSDDKE